MSKFLFALPFCLFSPLLMAEDIPMDMNTKSLSASEVESCHEFVASKYDTIIDHYKIHVKKDFNTILDQKVASALQESCLFGAFYAKNKKMPVFIEQIPYDEYQKFYSSEPILYGADGTSLLSALHDAAVYGSNLVGGGFDDGSRVTINGIEHKGTQQETPKYLSGKDTQENKQEISRSKSDILKSCLNITFLTIIRFNKDNNENYDLDKTASEYNHYCVEGYQYSKDGIPQKRIENTYIDNFKKKISDDPSKKKEMQDSISMAITLNAMGYKISDDNSLFEKSLAQYEKASRN